MSKLNVTAATDTAEKSWIQLQLRNCGVGLKGTHTHTHLSNNGQTGGKTRTIATRSLKLMAMPGQFCCDTSRESKPVGSTLASVRIRVSPRRYAALMWARLDDCVYTDNPLNNYPTSVRNHATSRARWPRINQLTSHYRHNLV